MTHLSSTSTELQLLLACARVDLTPMQADNLQQLLQQAVDWERLLALATRHGLIPLLYHRLSRQNIASLPDGVWRQLEPQYFENVAHTLKLSHELTRILATLAAADIPVIPYKGVVLGALLYGDPALRESGDIDLIVPVELLLSARDQLHACGYRSRFDLSPLQEQAYLRGTKDYSMIHSTLNVSVEVHWEIVTPQHATQIDWPGVWRRLDCLSVDGFDSVNVLGLEDHLLLLLIHGSNHRWEMLKWLVDVGALIDRNPNLDWNVLIARAENWRVKRTALLGLRLVHDLWGAQLPSDVCAAIKRDKVVKRLATEVVAVVDTTAPPPEHLGRIPFVMRLHEGWRSRFQYGWRVLSHMSFLDVDNDRPLSGNFLRGLFRRVRKRGRGAIDMAFARLANLFAHNRR